MSWVALNFGAFRTIACALLLLPTACRSEEAPRAAALFATTTGVSAVVRVQDAVTLLEHTSDAFERAPRLTLDPSPIATLGATDADVTYDLTFADFVALLLDGRVATLSQVENRLLIFGSDGAGQRVVGRQGNGPGEFMFPLGLVTLGGDTLLVPDRANARLNWVLPDRGVVADRPLPPTQLTILWGIAGRLLDGQLVMHAAGLRRYEPVAERRARRPTPIVLVDSHNGTAKTVAQLPDVEVTMVETRYRGRRRMTPEVVRFGRHAHVAVWDSLIATAIGEGYEIDLRASDGRIVARLRVPRARRAVTAAMRQAQIAYETDRFNAQRGERAIDPGETIRLIREAPFADSLPPYSGLFVTPGRTLWVVDPVAPGDTSWAATAFRTDGSILGRLLTSGTGRPVAFADDRVVVRTEDSDGVVHMRVHRIVER